MSTQLSTADSELTFKEDAKLFDCGTEFDDFDTPEWEDDDFEDGVTLIYYGKSSPTLEDEQDLEGFEIWF